MMSSMHSSDMTLVNVDAIEESSAFFTEAGWIIPAWVIELRASVILRNALIQIAICETKLNLESQS